MQSRSAPIVVLKVNGITMPVDIRELSPRSIRLLNRVDNRILTPFFYALGIDKRHIELDPATLVRASGRLNEPAEIYFTALAPAELQSSNSELQVGRYGNPRLLETVIKWLDASAKSSRTRRLRGNATSRRSTRPSIERSVSGSSSSLASPVRINTIARWSIRPG